MKKIIYKILSFTIAAVMIAGCEKYNDYTTDYDFSAIYFGTQTPIRTVVARDGVDDMTFKLGVNLGGIRDNQIERAVVVGLDPELLSSVDGADAFTLMPEDCYTTTLSDESRFTIPVGSYIGDFDIKVNKDKFAALEGSLENTYALPYRLIAAQADSILMGDESNAAKNYAIVVVKYISEHSGNYYWRGTVSSIDDNTDDANVLEEITNDWAYDDTACDIKVLKTITPSLISTSLANMGSDTAGTLLITLHDDDSVSVGSELLSVTDEGSTYDRVNDIYLLKYRYSYLGGYYRVEEQLKQRQDPELDLRFEIW